MYQTLEEAHQKKYDCKILPTINQLSEVSLGLWKCLLFLLCCFMDFLRIALIVSAVINHWDMPITYICIGFSINAALIMLQIAVHMRDCANINHLWSEISKHGWYCYPIAFIICISIWILQILLILMLSIGNTIALVPFPTLKILLENLEIPTIINILQL